MYADYCYDIIKSECEGLDAIYEDYIIRYIGTFGLRALKYNKLIENCGCIHGRNLYVLCEKESQ